LQLFPPGFTAWQLLSKNRLFFSRFSFLQEEFGGKVNWCIYLLQVEAKDYTTVMAGFILLRSCNFKNTLIKHTFLNYENIHRMFQNFVGIDLQYYA